MNNEFYPDLLRKREMLKQDDESEQQNEGEQGLQIQSKGKISFANNTFNNCILIFNFRGPEDKEADENGI